MAEHELVCVGSYPAEALAELARMRLEERGIESSVAADDCGGMLPFFQSVTGVRLSVAEPDALQAARILAMADGDTENGGGL